MALLQASRAVARVVDRSDDRETGSRMDVSYEQWLSGDAVAIGRAIMEPLAEAERVERALAVLDECRGHCRAIPQVDRVAEIARVPARWSEGHDAFRAVRQLTLAEERHNTTAISNASL